MGEDRSVRDSWDGDQRPHVQAESDRPVRAAEKRSRETKRHTVRGTRRHRDGRRAVRAPDLRREGLRLKDLSGE